MLDANVVAILGGDWSRVAAASAELLQSVRPAVPLITSGSTSASLDGSPVVFRTCYSDSQAQPLLASVLSLLASAKSSDAVPAADATAVGLIASEDDFGLAGLA
eukprot:4331421-Prymnesium_polylepis.1